MDLMFSIVLIGLILTMMATAKSKLRGERDLWVKRYYLEKIANNWAEQLTHSPGISGVVCQLQAFFPDDKLDECENNGDCEGGYVTLENLIKYGGILKKVCTISEHGFVLRDTVDDNTVNVRNDRVYPYTFYVPKVHEIFCNDSLAEEMFSGIAPYVEIGVFPCYHPRWENGTPCRPPQDCVLRFGDPSLRDNPHVEKVTLRRMVIYKGGSQAMLYITVAS